jgi:hypothetical protein
VKNLNDELEKWLKTNYKNLEKDESATETTNRITKTSNSSESKRQHNNPQTSNLGNSHKA